MTTGVNVAGTWRNLQNLSVNVGGVWRGCVNGYVNVGGTWKKFFQGLISDTFARTTSGSLGTSDTGAAWTALRGTWYANGSGAECDDAATNYSIATVALGSSTNITTINSITPGMGAAFWAQDANNWWAAVLFESTSTSTYSCTSCYACAVCASCTYTVTSSSTAYSCPPCTPTTYCSSWVCSAGTLCYGNNCCSGQNIIGSARCAQTGSSCPSSCTVSSSSQVTGANCSACGTTTGTCCSTGTCTSTTTNYYLRLISYVNGVASTPTSDITLDSAPAAIQVSTVGNAITAQAYSDNGLTTTLNSALTYTATSPTLGLNTGLVKTPSTNQGSTVGTFNSQP